MWESVSTARLKLRLMGATVPKPDDQLMTRFERMRKRDERDRPQGTVEYNPTIGETLDYSKSGFGVEPELIFLPWRQLVLRTIFSEGARDLPPYHVFVTIYADDNFDSKNYRDAGALYFYALQIAERDGKMMDSSVYYSLAACYRELGMHQRSAEVLRQGAKKSFQLFEDIIWTGDNQYLGRKLRGSHQHL